jgi:hypothetical protein
MTFRKSARRLVKMPSNGSVQRFATPPAASEPATDACVSPARTRVASDEIARPEIGDNIMHQRQSPRLRALALSSDVAMYAAIRVLQAEGRYVQALDIANAVLASQMARPSPNPKRPDIAASRAIIADIVHSLRRENRKGA